MRSCRSAANPSCRGMSTRRSSKRCGPPARSESNVPVLDASFLIDLHRHEPRARAAHDVLVREGRRMLVPHQAALEFVTGFIDPEAAYRRLELAYERVPTTGTQIQVGARLAAAALAAGKRGGWGDVQIAAAAMVEGTFVVTANPKHFNSLSVPGGR